MADTVIPPFATVADLEARWRSLTEAEEKRATVLLDDASQLILDICPHADTDPAATLRRITCAIVKRSMQNPAGDDGGAVTSTSITAGPYQQTSNFANPTGDLYLTKAEKLALGCGRQVAFEIDLLGSGGSDDSG